MILSNMDETADPCENFYEFSCGSFLNEVRIPDDQSKIDEFFMLRDKVAYSIADLLSEPTNKNDSFSILNAKRLYASCIDEWTIEEKALPDLLNVINKQFGGWPILRDGPYRRSRQSFLEFLVVLRKIDSPQLFEVVVSYNPKNPKRFILRVNLEPDKKLLLLLMIIINDIIYLIKRLLNPVGFLIKFISLTTKSCWPIVISCIMLFNSLAMTTET